MARGSRTSLASLASTVGANSPVERQPVRHGSPTAVPLTDLVANPHNPRDDIGDLADLASIAETQLQPALVVTREAFLRIYPQDEDALDAGRWVVINGCRRYAAAGKFGRAHLDVVVKDEIAQDRATLLAAAVTENIGRRDFDVIEEAKAIELMVVECGRAETVATKLGKTAGWVSQRRALLKLAPELQSALRRGELAIRQARALAQVPLEKQVNAWVSAAAAPSRKPADPERRRAPATSDKVVRAFQKLDVDTITLAQALRDYLDDSAIGDLLEALSASDGSK